MAGTVDNHSTDEFLLLKDAHLYVLSLTGYSEPLAEKVLRAFFSHGPVDREGRERYTIFETGAKLSGGRFGGRAIYNPRDPQFWYSDPEYGISCAFEFRHSLVRWSGPMVYPKAPSDEDEEPSDEDEEDEEVRQVDPQDKAEYHLDGIKLRREALLDFLRGAGWLKPETTEAATEPAAEPTQPQSEPEEPQSTRTLETKPQPEVASEPSSPQTASAAQSSPPALESVPNTEWTEWEKEIVKAAKKIYVSEGDIPPDTAPAKLQHDVDRLYKDEAAEKSKSGKNETPRTPPSWNTCSRFLEKLKTLRDRGLWKGLTISSSGN